MECDGLEKINEKLTKETLSLKSKINESESLPEDQIASLEKRQEEKCDARRQENEFQEQYNNN